MSKPDKIDVEHVIGGSGVRAYLEGAVRAAIDRELSVINNKLETNVILYNSPEGWPIVEVRLKDYSGYAVVTASASLKSLLELKGQPLTRQERDLRRRLIESIMAWRKRWRTDAKKRSAKKKKRVIRKKK